LTSLYSRKIVGFEVHDTDLTGRVVERFMLVARMGQGGLRIDRGGLLAG